MELTALLAEQTAFYVVGIVLVVVALAVSFGGLRFKDFPPSRGMLAGGIAVFAILVVATTATAVINAREEESDREAELAEEQAGEEAATAEETGAEGPSGASQAEQEAAQEAPAGGGTAPSGGGQTLKLTSPPDGDTAFEPAMLEAPAGRVTIEYTNPSPVSHDVAIARDSDVLAEGDLVTDGGTSTASGELQPGDYVYYCTVPGHREAGMDGTLSVK
jgi:plastocyanin